MTQFNIAAADLLVRKAVRHHIENRTEVVPTDEIPRLLKKKQELLAVLRQAEVEHDRVVAEIDEENSRMNLLKEARNNYKRFAKHFDRAFSEWQKMDEKAKLGLAWLAHASGPPGWLDTIVKRWEPTLVELQGAARSGGRDIQFPPGAPKRDDALMAFAQVLADFWSKATGESFSQEFVEIKSKLHPLSPAAVLLVEASNLLNQKYTASSCKYVMRTIQLANPS